MYLLTQTPVEIGRPIQLGFVEANKWSDPLFETYAQRVEENRKLGVSRTYLTKREIEKWVFFPPCGPRVEVIRVQLPE
jgi:hypothetical protein